MLLAPLAWPVIHGVGAALLSVDGPSFAGGGQLWPDARVAWLLLQGLGLALGAGLAATAVGGIAALAMTLPLRGAARWALLAGLAASFCFGTVVHLMAWRTPLPGVSGGGLGWALAITILALRYAPLAAALFVAGLVALERPELETALVTGGGRAAWRIAKGRLLRVAGMCVAAVAALAFGESELPPLLGLRVYAEEFLSQVALEPDAHRAAALGWPLMAVAAGCALLVSRLPRLKPAASGSAQAGWLGGWTHASALLRRGAPLLALAMSALPIVLLVAGAVRATGAWPAHAAEALASSVWVAAASAGLAVAWGWAIAAVASGLGAPAVRVVNLLAWLAMLWPSSLTALALAGWSLPGWMGAAAPLVLAHTLRALPFAAWVLLNLHGARARAPAEQVRVLGAAGWQAWRRISLPAARPALVAAFMLCVGLSLAELTATVLTVPAGMETVILRLYNLLHYGDQRGVMLLALLQSGAVALLVFLAWLAMSGTLRAGREKRAGA